MTTSEGTITLPAENISAGDLMDRAMDRLRTVYAALSGDNCDISNMASYSAVLDSAIADLEPVRDRLQGVDWMKGRHP